MQGIRVFENARILGIYIVVLLTILLITVSTFIMTLWMNKLPNQELSGAKSSLQGETVGVCTFYKRGGQPPYKSALRSLQMCLFVQI